ncbi:MAG: response regulator [Alphaproteobacteria bacterium]|nr:response regulator [Alphaproteobacteria bacterium]
MEPCDEPQEHGRSAALIAAMSHDLRTPLNGVLGMAELLLVADELSERNRRRAEIIKRSGQDLLAMLEQIIDFSKIEAEKPALKASPFDLRGLLREVETLFLSKNPNHTAKFDVADGLDRHHRVIGDAPYLKKLLASFVNSTMKLGAGAIIRVTVTTRTATAGKVRIRFETEDVSMDADAIERVLGLLEPGDGLPSEGLSEASFGLIICKQLAALQGAQLGLDHLSGAGPVFWLDIELETWVRNAADLDLPCAPAARETLNAKKAVRDILVAEDNPDMALLIEDFLEEAGYRAIVVSDGASVLKALGEQHVDVVLMDGRMPDMTGFEATERIRQLPDERADVPIIALTADALAGDREKYLSAGMDDYVAKPIDYDILLATIERCCCDSRQETLAETDARISS